MHSPPGQQPLPGWSRWPSRSPDDTNPWLYHAQRFSYVRAHISAFAAGSVILLALNLLVRSPDIWADTWITAWGLLVIMHGVIATMATLATQLMAEDDVRPASEVSWRPVSPDVTWVAPLEPKPEPVSPESPEDTWQAPPSPEPEGIDTAAEEERVSWQAASDAAWLNRPATDEAGISQAGNDEEKPDTDKADTSA